MAMEENKKEPLGFESEGLEQIVVSLILEGWL